MKCPVCDETLSISSREGVEIDFCPQCRGVWLDRGELDKIIDRVNAGVAPGAAAPPPPPPPGPGRNDRAHYDARDDRPVPRPDYDRRYDKRKKRRSLLEEIFDFD